MSFRTPTVQKLEAALRSGITSDNRSQPMAYAICLAVDRLTEVLTPLLQRVERENNPMMVVNLDQREKLAEYAHEAWSGWMKYLFEKSASEKHGGVTIPGNLVDRWLRQMHTPYKGLSEEEKDSDRIEADKILNIVGPKVAP